MQTVSRDSKQGRPAGIPGIGLGFSDFVRALRYPLQHKIALLCGAAIYGFLLLGGLKGQVIAFVIMFGCISQVISQVAWGRLNRSFMPDLARFLCGTLRCAARTRNRDHHRDVGPNDSPHPRAFLRRL